MASQPPPPPPSGVRKLNDNKAGEPKFQMKIEPDTALSFRAPSGGFVIAPNSYDQKNVLTLELKITNTTKTRQTYKVKCTNNEIFRVRPPLGFIKPDETRVLIVSFQATTKYQPENNKHFFAIYHFKTDDHTTPARQLWTGPIKLEGVKRVLACFENSDGTPLVTEKKEQSKQSSIEHQINNINSAKKDPSQQNSVDNNNIVVNKTQ